MQVSPASGSKDRVARCLLECPEKFKTSKPSTFPPLLLDAPTLPSFARLLLLDFRLLSARPPSSLFFSFFFFTFVVEESSDARAFERTTRWKIALSGRSISK